MKKRIRTLALNGTIPARLALALLWLSLFVYAGRPILVLARAGGVAPLAWAFLVLSAALPLLPWWSAVSGGERMEKPRRQEWRRSTAHWIGYATLGVFSTLLVLVAMSDLLRLAFVILPGAVPAQTLSIAVLGAAGVLSLVGLFQARFPHVKRVAVAIEGLPPELDGYRIVQWSDVHIGPTIQRRFVRSLVERTNRLEADAIAITGDLVDGHVDDLRDAVAPLADLRARDGVFVVTGNHEYYWRADEWVKELRRLGLVFLKNEHRVIEREGARLVMSGVTDPVGRYSHKQDPDAALRDAPADAVKVMLSHRPQTAPAADRLGVHLQLSGHTHGGQFFPFNLLIGFFQPIVGGLHRVGGTWLYVSRGTGYWGPPSRLGVRGEITVIELRSAPAQ